MSSGEARRIAKDVLAKLVNDRSGIKAVELVIQKELLDLDCIHDVTELLDELVNEGRVVCIEYTLPPDNDRLKGFYLPAGTALRIKTVNSDMLFQGGEIQVVHHRN
jgi:hypothetical protein